MDCEYKDENIHLKSIEGNVYKVNEDESLTLLLEKTNIPDFTYITQDEKSILFKINGKFVKYLKFDTILIENNDLVLEHEDKGE